MLERKIHVFDNIIDKKYQNKIKHILLGDYFPWFFVNDVTHTKNKKQLRPAFKHFFVINEKINSDYHQLVLPMILQSLKKIKYEHNKILQGRSFLQVPLAIKNKNIVDTPHIDLNNEHLVVLYYVLDNEAHTIIYKDKKSLKVLKKIQPKQGRVVIFNGKYWHTAEQPKIKNRCVINYNII
jgi:hypothetical protein